jgi:hypothetical protein
LTVGTVAGGAVGPAISEPGAALELLLQRLSRRIRSGEQGENPSGHGGALPPDWLAMNLLKRPPICRGTTPLLPAPAPVESPMLGPRPVPCPSCGVALDWYRPGAVEFLCPACDAGIRLRHRYFRVLCVSAIARDDPYRKSGFQPAAVTGTAVRRIGRPLAAKQTDSETPS